MADAKKCDWCLNYYDLHQGRRQSVSVMYNQVREDVCPSCYRKLQALRGRNENSKDIRKPVTMSSLKPIVKKKRGRPKKETPVIIESKESDEAMERALDTLQEEVKAIYQSDPIPNPGDRIPGYKVQKKAVEEDYSDIPPELRPTI